jgi:hypothetical protein
MRKQTKASRATKQVQRVQTEVYAIVSDGTSAKTGIKLDGLPIRFRMLKGRASKRRSMLLP